MALYTCIDKGHEIWPYFAVMVIWYSYVNLISFVSHIPSDRHFKDIWILVMAPMISDIKFDLTFEICNDDYPGIHVHTAYNSLFGGLWGHGSLLTASMTSKVKYYLWFEFSSLNYHGIHEHVAARSHFGGSWGHCGLQTASEVANGLGSCKWPQNWTHWPQLPT